MKLASVSVLSISGRSERRRARALAASGEGARTSIVLGDVSGSFVRSSTVCMDSVRMLRRCSGLASNFRKGSADNPIAAAMPAEIRIARLRRLRNASTGANRAMPTSFHSPAGFISLSKAGSIVALGAVAHRILDAKIDADADEQRNESDGDNVESADHNDGESGGDRQSCKE